LAERAVIAVDPAQIETPLPAIRVGLIGHGIQLSRTPRMHVNEGAVLGIDYRYDLIDTAQMHPVPALAALLAGPEAEGFAGLNVTHPFKQEVIQHLDHLSDAARAVNAVNTVVFRDGQRFGHNTDYWGFAQAFGQNMGSVRKDRVLLLGAGGAGGAVAHALIDNGVGHLAIFDPATAAAEKLVSSLAARVGAGRVSRVNDVAAEMKAADGIVNASPVGMAALPGSPVPLAHLNVRHWVGEIIYFPLETALLAAARAKGCHTMDGSGMAVFQAVRAFELFSGVRPDPIRMRATFDAFTPQPAGSSGL